MNTSGVAGFDAAKLLAALPDAVIIVDEKGQITAANDHALALFGYDWEDLASQSVEMLVPTELRGRHVQDRHQYMEDPQTRPMGPDRRLYAQRKDGERFLAEISLSPLLGGEDPWVVAAIRDVTERVRLEQEFQETQRRLRDML